MRIPTHHRAAAWRSWANVVPGILLALAVLSLIQRWGWDMMPSRVFSRPSRKTFSPSTHLPGPARISQEQFQRLRQPIEATREALQLAGVDVATMLPVVAYSSLPKMSADFSESKPKVPTVTTRWIVGKTQYIVRVIYVRANDAWVPVVFDTLRPTPLVKSGLAREKKYPRIRYDMGSYDPLAENWLLPQDCVRAEFWFNTEDGFPHRIVIDGIQFSSDRQHISLIVRAGLIGSRRIGVEGPSYEAMSRALTEVLKPRSQDSKSESPPAAEATTKSR